MTYKRTRLPWDPNGGIGQLSKSLTINSTTVSPMFRYDSGLATPTLWKGTAGFGGDLTIADTGTAQTFDVGGPWGRGINSGIKAAGGECFRAGENSTGGIATEDFVFELVFIPLSINGAILAKTATGQGWQCYMTSGSALQLNINDGSGTASMAMPGVDVGTLVHALFFVDRDEASTNGGQVYVNDVRTVSADMSARAGSLAISQPLTITDNAGLAFGASAYIFLFQGWKQASWHPGGSSNPTAWNAIATARYRALMGLSA